jgi:hypothetical protein
LATIEKGHGSYRLLGVLRWVMVLTFISFGIQKFAPVPLLRWADTSRWDGEPCPPREWAVKDRIPLRQVTLLSGEGSIGKSIIELMCAVAHVTGKDWLKSLPEPGGAFYIGCEDDEVELRTVDHS